MYRPIDRTLRSRRAGRETGFTLIELLVVVVVIGVLIAIAIPLYLNYRQGANDRSAASDLRNAIATFEQCNSAGSTYPNVGTTGNAFVGPSYVFTPCDTADNNRGTLIMSKTTTMHYWSSRTTRPVPAYLLTTSNSGGSGAIYCYSSATGGAVTVLATSPSVYRDTC